jgi:hypothetical protein
VALNLFGVTVNDARVTHLSVPDTQTIVVRELAAICGESEYRAVEADDDAVQRYSSVVTTYATGGPVLPAPIGVVFRSSESVQRWLELHYGALTDAITFVQNRVGGRVHVSRPGADETREPGVDISAAAEESLRVLRVRAAATLPLRVEKSTDILLSAAFLIEQDSWKDFAAEVEAQARIATSVRFVLTGPWPPYDFIQMQFRA